MVPKDVILSMAFKVADINTADSFSGSILVLVVDCLTLRRTAQLND